MTTLPSVLVIEDDAAIRALLTTALGREPLHVDSAIDGLVALEKIAARQYAVILLDLMMPRMNGYAFIEALRELRQPVRPVVIAMTAHDDGAFLQLDSELVHGCLRKPFDLEQVTSTVRSCAELLHPEIEVARVSPVVGVDAPAKVSGVC